MTIELRLGDCLDIMPALFGPYDMILADLPYGTTDCKWDTVIPFAPLWEQYKRLIKKRGAVVLFGSQPFTSVLISSNIDQFQHLRIWIKDRSLGFFTAPYMPLRMCEEIAIFSWGKFGYQSTYKCTYNPQMEDGKEYPARKAPRTLGFALPQIHERPVTSRKGYFKRTSTHNGKKRHPKDWIYFPSVLKGRVHPTQKPVALLEYLIRTYTNEGETVLDNTMGSGSTGVACVNTGRSFVGIEMDAGYFEIAETRIAAAQAEMIQPALPGGMAQVAGY